MLELAAATQAELIEEALVLMLVGMTVVFTGLIALLVLANLIGLLGETRGSKTASPQATAMPQTVPSAAGASVPQQAAPITPETDPQLIAVLTAAATAALQRPVRVQSARNYLGRQRLGGWSQMGRRSIMTSHRPRR